MRRRTLGAALAGAVVAALVAGPASADPADVWTVGLLVDAASPDDAAAGAAVRDALRGGLRGGHEVRLTERAATSDDADERFALRDAMQVARVVVAVGATASRLAPDVFRDRTVVIVAPGAPPPYG